MIERGKISIAICDNGCGAEGETDDVRNRHGGITQSHLPAGWKFLRIAGEDLHLCPSCVPVDGDLFADRREAFEARYADFGCGLLPEICISLGMPIAIGRQWAAEIDKQQRRVA